MGGKVRRWVSGMVALCACRRAGTWTKVDVRGGGACTGVDRRFLAEGMELLLYEREGGGYA